MTPGSVPHRSHRIRPAGPQDVPTLISLRSEAESWLRSIGSSQWSDPEKGSAAMTKWRKSIDDGLTWVVVDDEGGVDATVSLGPADPDFWDESDSPESGLYVYKLMVRRDQSGLALGDRILDWAGRNAALQGRRWLRLDVWRDAPKLQAYYLNRGFTHVRTVSPSHRLSGWLGQRPAELVLSSLPALEPSRRWADAVPNHRSPSRQRKVTDRASAAQPS